MSLDAAIGYDFCQGELLLPIVKVFLTSTRKPHVHMTSSKLFKQSCALFAVIVVIGVASRLWIETPNFKPLAALALFSGFYFRNAIWAMGAMFAILVISDWQLGGYAWPLRTMVYLSMGISVSLGLLIRHRHGAGIAGSQHSVGSAAGRQQFNVLATRFIGASLLMSTLFFLLTNGAVWWQGQWYSDDLTGLLSCYTAGLPFFRWTITGDLFFTTLIVGSYQAVLAIRFLAQPVDTRLLPE